MFRSVYDLLLQQAWLLVICHRRPVNEMCNTFRILLFHLTDQSWQCGGYFGRVIVFVLSRLFFLRHQFRKREHCPTHYDGTALSTMHRATSLQQLLGASWELS